jgi:monoamine oxidase
MHLSDPGFASKIQDARPTVGSEEIAKVTEEWKEKQKKKAEAKESKAKEGESKKEKQEIGKDKQEEIKKDSPPQSTHEKYALHRDFFASRSYSQI